MSNTDSKITALANDWFVRLRDDNVKDEDIREFKLWLNENSLHKAAYQAAEELWLNLDQLDSTDFLKSINTEQSIENDNGTIHIETNSEANSKTRNLTSSSQFITQFITHWYRAPSILLSLSVLAVISYVAYFPQSLGEYYTKSGEQKSIELIDGSIIKLNTNTELSTQFDISERRLTLHNGEAQFKVSKDRIRPFVVNAGSYEIKALGTAFNIKVTNEDTIELIVTEHSVKITNADGDSTIVRSGHGVRADKNTLAAIPKTQLNTNLAWQQGRLSFVKQPLTEVLNEIDRYHPGRIILMDRSIKNTPITGTFQSINSNDILRVIEKTQPIYFIHVSQWLTLGFGK